MSIAEKFETIADEVYKKGKVTEALAWQNAITNNGKRTVWISTGVFAYSDFSDIEFAQPFVMVGSTNSVFRQYAGEKLPRKQDIDMTGITSAPTMFSYLYGGKRKMTVPDYGIPALDGYTQTYDYARDVETIEVIRCHEGTTFDRTFSNCDGLKNITFEGVIGTNISFLPSPLSVDSMKNIIEHLKDYSVNEPATHYTVTFKDTTELEAEGATAEYNGTPCTWLELIAYKKWDLG